MQKYARKVILIIAALLLLLMTACGDQGRPEPTAQNSAPVVITAETETPKPESTAEPEQTEVPDETAAPEQAETPEETTAPEQTETPAETTAPELTEAPAPTDEPEQPAVTQTPEPTAEPQMTQEDPNAITVEEDGEYTDKEHVALYIHLYGHLPSNYVTKEEARAAGWSPEAGNLITVLPGKSIGGDYFGNYEKLLPKAKGRKYYECDINFNPKGKTSGRVTRGGERIVYSNDGLIFYTGDHYNTYEQLY